MRARLFPAGRSPPATAILCHYLHLLAELSQPEILKPDDLILPHCCTQLAEAANQIVAATSFRAG